jgi:hypothetical protein
MTELPLKARSCRWINVPGASDVRGSVNFIQLGKGLDFEPRRFFYLNHVAPGEWRGRRSHRETELLLIAVSGSCRAHLDDGVAKETVRLDDPARALHVAPWIWYELTDFAPGTVILVLASTAYDAAEQLRDYELFQREVGTHAR